MNALALAIVLIAAVPAGAPRGPEQRVLSAIEDEGRRRVSALWEEAREREDGPALRDVHRQIAAVKRETRARFLTALAAFARERGDLAAAREADDALEALTRPALPRAAAAWAARKPETRGREMRP